MVKWLNPAYDGETLHNASSAFKKKGSVQLLFFLSQRGFDSFKLKFKRFYEPKKHSYSVARAPSFVKSAEFCAVISAIIGRNVHVKFAEVRMFDKGDYTVLYDALKQSKNYILMLDLVDWDVSWGGYSSFMRKKEVARVVPRGNALSVIDAKGLKTFTKYVNHHASFPRIFLYAELAK